jgi:hypothetical protein
MATIEHRRSRTSWGRSAKGHGISWFWILVLLMPLSAISACADEDAAEHDNAEAKGSKHPLIQVLESSPSIDLSVELKSASLVIRSNVHGDEVAIDGIVAGPTGPHAHSVVPGRHTVAVSKQGYETWEGKIEVAADETAVVRAVLSRPNDRRVSEIIDWIRGKIRSHGRVRGRGINISGEVRIYTEDLEAQGCIVSGGATEIRPGWEFHELRTSPTWTRFAILSLRTRFVADLSRMSQEVQALEMRLSGYTDHYYVEVHAVNNERIIARSESKSGFDGSESSEQKKAAFFSLDFRDMDIARRVANALSDAIKLCGGSAELY